VVSDHADADPALSSRPADLSDLYVFRGDAGTVLIMTAAALSGAGGFRPGWQYAFHVTSPDAGWHPELTYRLTFASHDGAQLVQLRQIDGPQAGDRDAEGTLVTSGITEALLATGGGVRLWAGLAANPAWIHGGILSFAEQCIAGGAAFEALLAALALPGINLLAYTSVHAIVLEIPGRLPGGDRIGVWATAAAAGPEGWKQASRCAFPLLPTLFAVSHGGTCPHEDRSRYGRVISAGAARAAGSLGTSPDPEAHGARVAQRLLPDVLPYQQGTGASFSLAAVNGRGLTDPAAEAVISQVLGTHVPLGLDASSAPGHLRAVFPYLSVPVEPAPEPVMFLTLREPRARR
jgi:Domain of unknown function (DUF4331)